MQLTLERTPFLKALDRVAKLVERKTTIPILSHLSLAAGDGTLTIAGTDLDIEGITRLPADIDEPGACAVSAQILADIARKLPDGAQISLKLNGERLALKSGRARFELAALSAQDFPEMAPGEPTHRFTLTSVQLCDLFGKVAFAISTEETRYYLNGIFLHTALKQSADGSTDEQSDGALWLTAVATDGHRLAKIAVPAPEGAAGMPGIIVPRKTVAEILRLGKDHSGEITIALSDRKIRLTLGETVLTSKLIDGSFPEYSRVIPQTNERLATLDREPFLNAAERVATISGDRGRAIKLSFDAGRLTLSVSNQDLGSAEEEIEADFSGTPIEIGFNAAYLREILSLVEGPTCLVKLDAPGSPTIFAARADAAHIIVLMPMRV